MGVPQKWSQNILNSPWWWAAEQVTKAKVEAESTRQENLSPNFSHYVFMNFSFKWLFVTKFLCVSSKFSSKSEKQQHFVNMKLTAANTIWIHLSALQMCDAFLKIYLSQPDMWNVAHHVQKC